MSNVSNRHTVIPFVAGKSTALSNQRLIRVLYKPSKKVAQKYPSVCVSVPNIEEPLSADTLDKLNPYIIEMIQKAQDGIVKNMYEESKGKLSNISDEDISINAVISFLEEESSGGRLNKEILYSWFDEFLKDNLTVTIAEKLNIDDIDDEKIIKAVNGYKEMIASLSGGATVYSEKQVKNLLKVLELSSAEDDDAIIGRLNKRLNNMISKDMSSLIEL